MTASLRRSAKLLFIVLLTCAACRQGQVTPADIQLELSASDRRVGETTLLVSVTDKDGKAIAQPGKLNVRGDMNHAGMIPVFAESDQATEGLFSLPFEWTMGGSWIVEASVKLPNGEVASQTFNFEILREASEDEHSNMDHGGMDQAEGEASAVYMRISNRGASDRVIVSAASAAAERIEFHRTIVEADIARMEALDALVIPAGETLLLQPGGAHIMLSGLAEDLRPDGSFSLQLKCDAGEVYELDISIANMLMDELDDAVEYGDLVFSNRWARPAKAGGMAHGDMPMNEDSAARKP
ncbi:MAG: copper chaperone PCu(A)C [Chloroflexota bacterium]|nr:copper chaperone PCu(A)C [Chloroflexota bacterium]